MTSREAGPGSPDQAIIDDAWENKVELLESIRSEGDAISKALRDPDMIKLESSSPHLKELFGQIWEARANLLEKARKGAGISDDEFSRWVQERDERKEAR